MLFITGMRGIGKSSVVKQVQHFLNDRKQCTSGNIYIECKNVKTYYQLLKTVQRNLMNLMKLKNEAKSKILEDTCSEEAMQEFLIDFI